jgi:hypothetical protein
MMFIVAIGPQKDDLSNKAFAAERKKPRPLKSNVVHQGGNMVEGVSKLPWRKRFQ